MAAPEDFYFGPYPTNSPAYSSGEWDGDTRPIIAMREANFNALLIQGVRKLGNVYPPIKSRLQSIDESEKGREESSHNERLLHLAQRVLRGVDLDRPPPRAVIESFSLLINRNSTQSRVCDILNERDRNAGTAQRETHLAWLRGMYATEFSRLLARAVQPRPGRAIVPHAASSHNLPLWDPTVTHDEKALILFEDLCKPAEYRSFSRKQFYDLFPTWMTDEEMRAVLNEKIRNAEAWREEFRRKRLAEQGAAAPPSSSDAGAPAAARGVPGEIPVNVRLQRKQELISMPDEPFNRALTAGMDDLVRRNQWYKNLMRGDDGPAPTVLKSALNLLRHVPASATRCPLSGREFEALFPEWFTRADVNDVLEARAARMDRKEESPDVPMAQASSASSSSSADAPLKEPFQGWLMHAVNDVKHYFHGLDARSRETFCEAAGLLCPVTLAPFEDPVTLSACGHTVDRQAMLTSRVSLCPLCKVPLTVTVDALPTNYAIAQAVELMTCVPRKRAAPLPVENARQQRLRRVMGKIVGASEQQAETLVDRALEEVEKAPERGEAFFEIPTSWNVAAIECWKTRMLEYGFKVEGQGARVGVFAYRLVLPTSEQALAIMSKMGGGGPVARP